MYWARLTATLTLACGTWTLWGWKAGVFAFALSSWFDVQLTAMRDRR